MTLKTLRHWLSAALLIGLLAPVGAAELPREVATVVNTLEFVAGFAARCDHELSLQGAAGIEAYNCRVYHKELNRAQASLKASGEAFRAAAEAADQSTDRVLRLQWQRAMTRLQTAMERITYTNDHLAFLNQAEADTPKQPARRPKK
jgi:hypothetical protein